MCNNKETKAQITCPTIFKFAQAFSALNAIFIEGLI